MAGQVDPRYLWRLVGACGVPAAAGWRASPPVTAGAQHRHACRRPHRRGRRSRARHAGGIRGACRRHQGPHRAGAARADVRGRHHPPPPQVPGSAGGGSGGLPDRRTAGRTHRCGLLGPPGRRRHPGCRHRARGRRRAAANGTWLADRHPHDRDRGGAGRDAHAPVRMFRARPTNGSCSARTSMATTAARAPWTTPAASRPCWP